jgi:CRISPR/Cas system-associated protein Cas5 (RAMP superfamily)
VCVCAWVGGPTLERPLEERPLALESVTRFGSRERAVSLESVTRWGKEDAESEREETVLMFRQASKTLASSSLAGLRSSVLVS